MHWSTPFKARFHLPTKGHRCLIFHSLGNQIWLSTRILSSHISNPKVTFWAAARKHTLFPPFNSPLSSYKPWGLRYHKESKKKSVFFCWWQTGGQSAWGLWVTIYLVQTELFQCCLPPGPSATLQALERIPAGFHAEEESRDKSHLSKLCWKWKSAPTQNRTLLGLSQKQNGKAQ